MKGFDTTIMDNLIGIRRKHTEKFKGGENEHIGSWPYRSYDSGDNRDYSDSYCLG